MEQGKVVRIHSNFYYVLSEDTVYECFLRGRLKKERKKAVVGDVVDFQKTGDTTGVIEDIQERRTLLSRPAVANLDQTVIVFSVKNPEPNHFLLDKFLVLAEEAGVEIVICLQKSDLLPLEEIEKFASYYKKLGYSVILSSAKEGLGIEELKELLKGKLTAFAGPSGVGKSSILNLLQNERSLKTGELSEKIQRGKNTTRHVELFSLDNGGLVVDAPGFSSLDLSHIKQEELAKYFSDFRPYLGDCYKTCLHDKEKTCSVKEAVANGEIAKERYEHYLKMLSEINNAKKKR